MSADAPQTPADGEILQAIADEARRRLDFQKPLEPALRLVEDLELDSIRLLTLAMAVEDRFRIALDADDEASIKTVADLVALVRRKLAELHDPEAAPAAG